jgi:hypothetical protein
VTIAATLMAGIIDVATTVWIEKTMYPGSIPRQQKAVGLPMAELIARRVRAAIEERKERQG